MSKNGKAESGKSKRSSRVMMLLLLFCVAVPGILYLTGSGEELLTQVRAMFGF